MGSRVKDIRTESKLVTCAMMSSVMGGSTREADACASSLTFLAAGTGRGRRMGRGATGVVTEFVHEELETSSTTGGGNDGTWRGVWPRRVSSPPEPVSVSLCFRQGVAVTVQFGHREGGLRVRTWACGDVTRRWAHPQRVGPAETVKEEHLKDRRHSASLTQGQSPDNQIRGERRGGNRDYAARPFTTGQIRTVLLVLTPETEGEGF